MLFLRFEELLRGSRCRLEWLRRPKRAVDDGLIESKQPHYCFIWGLGRRSDTVDPIYGCIHVELPLKIVSSSWYEWSDREVKSSTFDLYWTLNGVNQWLDKLQGDRREPEGFKLTVLVYFFIQIVVYYITFLKITLTL